MRIISGMINRNEDHTQNTPDSIQIKRSALIVEQQNNSNNNNDESEEIMISAKARKPFCKHKIGFDSNKDKAEQIGLRPSSILLFCQSRQEPYYLPSLLLTSFIL